MLGEVRVQPRVGQVDRAALRDRGRTDGVGDGTHVGVQSHLRQAHLLAVADEVDGRDGHVEEASREADHTIEPLIRADGWADVLEGRKARGVIEPRHGREL